jgi:hypothetical protein
LLKHPEISAITNGLSGSAVETLRELLEQLDEKDKRMEAYDARMRMPRAGMSVRGG